MARVNKKTSRSRSVMRRVAHAKCIVRYQNNVTRLRMQTSLDISSGRSFSNGTLDKRLKTEPIRFRENCRDCVRADRNTV